MERDLLVRFKSARNMVEMCEQALKDANKEEADAQQALIDYLESVQSHATGRYDIGWAQIHKPRLYASATQEVLPGVLEWLRTHGHETAVKETVHPSSLSQIVGEQLQAGDELPPGVTFYLKPVVRLYTNGG